MYLENEWRRLDGEEREAVLSRVGAGDDSHRISPVTTEVWARALAFYKGMDLLRLRDAAWRPEALSVYFLRPAAGALLRLDGKSQPIHHANEQQVLALAASEVLDYLRFFCFFVHGDDGPFYVLYSFEDANLPPGFWDAGGGLETGNPSPRDLFRQPRLFGADDRGQFRVSAMVYYGSTVFMADFLIAPDGNMEMPADTLLTDVGMRLALPIA